MNIIIPWKLYWFLQIYTFLRKRYCSSRDHCFSRDHCLTSNTHGQYKNKTSSKTSFYSRLHQVDPECPTQILHLKQLTNKILHKFIKRNSELVIFSLALWSFFHSPTNLISEDTLCITTLSIVQPIPWCNHFNIPKILGTRTLCIPFTLKTNFDAVTLKCNNSSNYNHLHP